MAARLEKMYLAKDADSNFYFLQVEEVMVRIHHPAFKRKNDSIGLM